MTIYRRPKENGYIEVEHVSMTKEERKEFWEGRIKLGYFDKPRTKEEKRHVEAMIGRKLDVETID